MKNLSERNIGAALGLGAAFGVVGWLLFESITIAIGFAIAMGIAFSGVPKSPKVTNEDVSDKA